MMSRWTFRTADKTHISKVGEPKDLLNFFGIFLDIVSRNAEVLGIGAWRLRIIERDLDRPEIDCSYDYTTISGTEALEGVLCIKQTLAQEYDAIGPHNYHGRVEIIAETDNSQIATKESRAMFVKLALLAYYTAIKAVYPEYTTRYIDAPTTLEGGVV